MPRLVCRCTAYRWPHTAGHGQCTVTLTGEPTMIVQEVLEEYQGLTLAKTDTGAYLVGICYRPGTVVAKLNPNVDFLSTTSPEVAKDFFNRKANKP